MNKVFLLNKPENMTSQSLVYKVKKKFNLNKVGHCGTLDPFASGLMIILTNEATKISDFLMEHKKAYVARLKLGEYTESFDTELPVTKIENVPNLSKDFIIDTLNTFKGINHQLPPVYSAIKINGRKLYELKRNDEEIPEIKPREIEIYDIRLESFIDNILEFYVECSKGTYIRSLGVDIATRLGTIGHLISLKRVKINDFSLDNAKTINELEEDDGLAIKDCLNLSNINVDEKMYQDVKNGRKIHINSNEKLILLVYNDKEVALYEKENETLYRCYRGFNC